MFSVHDLLVVAIESTLHKRHREAKREFKRVQIPEAPQRLDWVGSHPCSSHRTPYLLRLENPMDGGAWWAAVHGVTKSRTRLSDFIFIPLGWPWEAQSSPRVVRESWGLRSGALNMPTNLGNSAVATGLEKVSFHSNPKERQCQRMLKLPHNCTHLTC